MQPHTHALTLDGPWNTVAQRSGDLFQCIVVNTRIEYVSMFYVHIQPLKNMDAL